MLVVLDVQTHLIPSQYDVARCLSAMVHAAAEHNLVLLEHHPETPRLLDTALQFVPASPQLRYETIRSIPLIIEANGGDCAEWIAWRLAENWRDELRNPGRRLSNCKVYWRDRCGRCHHVVNETMRHCPRCKLPMMPGTIKREYHAELRNPDGSVEDTSRLLGM